MHMLSWLQTSRPCGPPPVSSLDLLSMWRHAFKTLSVESLVQVGRGYCTSSSPVPISASSPPTAITDDLIKSFLHFCSQMAA